MQSIVYRRRSALPDTSRVITVGGCTYDLIEGSDGRCELASAKPHRRLQQPAARRRLRSALRNSGISVQCVWRPMKDGSNRIVVAVFCWATGKYKDAKQVHGRIRSAFSKSHPRPFAVSATARGH